MCEKMIKNPYRRVWACVNLDALHDNLRQIAACRKNDAGIIAVIKADGYGHGAVMLAREMDEIPEVIGYAVATEEEAVLLADAGIKKPVMVLGYTFPEAYEEMALRGVHATVFTDQMLEDMNRAAQKAGKKMHVHIAVDTGMGRIGYSDDVTSVEDVKMIAGLSHFATADAADKTYATVQEQRYMSFYKQLLKEGIDIPLRTLGNSAAVMEINSAYYDMVRPGVILYGLYPSDEVDRSQLALRPAMSIKANIIHLKKVPAGNSISYGRKFTTQRDSLIATIPVGYADGLPRPYSAKGKVIVNGVYAPIAGTICMDMCMIDVTHVPYVRLGDEVTIMGKDGIYEITADDIARETGTINYEVVCGFGQRLPKVYVY